MAIRNLTKRAFGTPFLGNERSWGYRSYHCRLSIVTIALSLTIQPQFVMECLWRTIQQGWVTFGQNFRIFPME